MANKDPKAHFNISRFEFALVQEALGHLTVRVSTLEKAHNETGKETREVHIQCNALGYRVKALEAL